MLAGTVYFYNIEDKLIEEMDLYDYEDMSEEDFLKYIEKIKAVRVTIGSFSHNHQSKEYVEELYNKKK